MNNLADRNKILIAGAVVAVAIVLIAFFVVRGRKPAAAGGGAGSFTQGAQGTETAAAPTGGAPPAPGAAAPAEAGGEAPAAAAPSGPGPSVGVVQMGIGPAEPTRTDPTLTFEPPPQPTPPELLVSMPPVNLVEGGLRPGGLSTAGPMVGNRRVAGVVFNDQAWAILQDEQGEYYVVKPGDIVNGIRITAISRNSIFLLDQDGKRWEVPLRGLGPEPAAASSSTVAAMPTSPPT